jgi:SAM-dependent methyltransferase
MAVTSPVPPSLARAVGAAWPYLNRHLQRHLRWPLPALLLWAACWSLHGWLRSLDCGAGAAFAIAGGLGGAAALMAQRRWRQWMLAGGFPLSALASGAAAGLPAWAWLLPLGLLALAYPLRAWRDAPVFPTPPNALAGLAEIASLPAGASVLDAGCGLGHGLRALRRQYPQAALHGIEWSWALRCVTALRCRWARIRQGDMWGEPWSGHTLVYLFQRPESMPRAWAKAQAELDAGGWLVSLAFAVPGQAPWAVLREGHELPVWIYRIGASATPAR